MIDLSNQIELATDYLGLHLKNPLVASSSPLAEEIGNLRRLEDAGAAAVVLPSLFEEQIQLESDELDRILSGSDSFHAEAGAYFPDLQTYNAGPDGYLDHLRKAREALQIPVIGSLNGTSRGGWIRYAKEMEQAGAHALELNIYDLPHDPALSGEEMERRYVDLVRAVKASVEIPVAVKLSPYFSSLPYTARRLDEAGAGALILFNRFYQPDFDLERMEVVPTLSLSTSQELLLRLHWIAALYGNVRTDLALTGGVHDAVDVVKAIMAGASVAMMTSALLKRGIGYLSTVLNELLIWCDDHEYLSVRQMRGSMSRRAVKRPKAYDRANYMKVLSSFALR